MCTRWPTNPCVHLLLCRSAQSLCVCTYVPGFVHFVITPSTNPPNLSEQHLCAPAGHTYFYASVHILHVCAYTFPSLCILRSHLLLTHHRIISTCLCTRRPANLCVHLLLSQSVTRVYVCVQISSGVYIPPKPILLSLQCCKGSSQFIQLRNSKIN